MLKKNMIRIQQILIVFIAEISHKNECFGVKNTKSEGFVLLMKHLEAHIVSDAPVKPVKCDSTEKCCFSFRILQSNGTRIMFAIYFLFLMKFHDFPTQVLCTFLEMFLTSGETSAIADKTKAISFSP